MGTPNYTKVTGQIGAQVADGADAGTAPDTAWAVAGTVRLTPVHGLTKWTDPEQPAGPFNPAMLAQPYFDAAIGADGKLTWNGESSIDVVDFSDLNLTPHVDDTEATHWVEFIGVRSPGGVAISVDRYPVRLTGEAVNLIAQSPALTGGGVYIMKGDTGTSIVAPVQPEPGTLAFELSDGTTTDSIVLPDGVVEAAAAAGSAAEAAQSAADAEESATEAAAALVDSDVFVAGRVADPASDTNDALSAFMGDQIATDGTPAEVALSAKVAQAIGNNSGTSQASAGLRASVAAGLTTGFSVIGDSTGNEANEWPYLFGQAIASAHPEYTVQHVLWSDTASDMLPPTTIQTGTAGAQYLDTASSIAARSLTLAASPHTPAIVDIRVKVRMPDWTPPATAIMVSREGGSGKRSWYFTLNANGRLALNYSTDGATVLTKESSVVTGITDGTLAWIRAVYTPSSEVKFYTSTDGATWTQLGATLTHTDGVLFDAATPYELGGRQGGTSSNTAQIHTVDVRDGLNGKPIVPRLPALWGGLVGNAATVVGAPVFTVVNGSHPGADVAYWTTAYINKATASWGQRLGFLSLSHNQNAQAGPGFVRDYSTLMTSMKSSMPGVPLVGVTQNPEKSPRLIGFIQGQAARRVDIITAAASVGGTSIDTYQAFVDAGLALTVDSGGVHPTPAGSLLWRDAVLAATGLV